MDERDGAGLTDTSSEGGRRDRAVSGDATRVLAAGATDIVVPDVREVVVLYVVVEGVEEAAAAAWAAMWASNSCSC